MVTAIGSEIANRATGGTSAPFPIEVKPEDQDVSTPFNLEEG